MEEQEAILNENFKGIEFLKVPANGWNLSEIKNILSDLSIREKNFLELVFVSPVPAMVMMAACIAGHWDINPTKISNVFVFHNDNRDKKEFPNGKIIMTISETGWKLIDMFGREL
jgi:serine protease inhibitor